MLDALNVVYRERAYLVAYLASRHASSVLVEGADPKDPGWPLLFVKLPDGRQVSWYIAPDDLDLFLHVPRIKAKDKRAPRWDGHTIDTKYARLHAHTTGAA